MKNVVILGNSLAAFCAADAVRQAAPEWPVKIFLPDEEYPYDALLLPDFLSKKIPLEQVFAAPKEEYAKKNITVAASKIQRINFSRKKIITEDKATIPFDVCILTAGSWLPQSDIKGIHKEGVFLTQSLADFKKALTQLPLAETIFIQGDCLTSLRLAGGVAGLSKEIILITNRERIGADFMDEASSSAVTAALAEQGVRFLLQDTIAEMLGDNDLKAVRLKNGKVIAGQMAFVSSAKTDWRPFKETGLDAGPQIPGEMPLETNIPDVFVLDIARGNHDLLAAGYDSYRQLINQQAQIIAARLLGRPIEHRQFIPQARFRIAEKFFNLSDRVLS